MLVWLERGCKKDLKYVRMVCILAAVKCLSGRLVVVRDGTPAAVTVGGFVY
jgi:hypothetical protein